MQVWLLHVMSGIFNILKEIQIEHNSIKGYLRCLTCLRLKNLLAKSNKPVNWRIQPIPTEICTMSKIPSLSAIYYMWDNLMLKKNYALKKYSSSKILYFGNWRLCTSKPAKGYIKKKKR